MVAYLKAIANEKTYSNYLQAAREAEKEEAMEPSHSQTTDKTSKPKVMSFFPLQKLKGTQPTKTPVVRVVHLEEEGSNKETGTESKDPDGIDGAWWRSLSYTLLGQWKRPNRIGSTATIAVAWNILSASVCWWRHPGQLPI